MSKGIRAFVEEAKKSDSYWVEKAKLDFSLGLEKQRRASKLTYAAIAEKIGTSAAYITKVFRGDTNVTIETMVKLARAAGGQVNIQIVDSSTASAQWGVARAHSIENKAPLTTSASATIIDFPQPANKDVFQWKRAA